jgi:hypothetical protein
MKISATLDRAKTNTGNAGAETYKSSGFFTYRQVQDLKFMHGARIAFMWFLSISGKEKGDFCLV